jgi:hypothetical protein
MKTSYFFSIVTSAIAAFTLSPESGAQSLPGSLGFSIKGSFVNGQAESSNSILIADNDLSDGYAAGFDTTDAPSALTPSGTEGSAAFLWGEAARNSDYAHSSALWFQSLSVSHAIAEQSFELGYLSYRNGTIKNKTGATWVDLALTIAFSQPLGLEPVSVVFGSELINTVNTDDAIASADIVSLRNLAAPIQFTDEAGNQYFLELTFKVDQDTLDGTLSSQDQFRVIEGSQGTATLMGRFTTTPVCIPEPSAALLGGLGLLLLIRRKR